MEGAPWGECAAGPQKLSHTGTSAISSLCLPAVPWSVACDHQEPGILVQSGAPGTSRLSRGTIPPCQRAHGGVVPLNVFCQPGVLPTDSTSCGAQLGTSKESRGKEGKSFSTWHG